MTDDAATPSTPTTLERAAFTAAPGWYPDPATGRQRWWDGAGWGPLPERAVVNGPAITSLVLGIVSVVLFGTIIGILLAVPAAVAGVVTGVFGIAVSRRPKGTGRVMSIIGLCLSAVPVLGLAAALIWG